ncbi:MAG: ADP-dependent phosphofructokinase/glucokinase [Euryarchaeota archaeon]|nr:ADP-dependent phosphofructokinase/glucokinase [Euryarchaeota archaeon]
MKHPGYSEKNAVNQGPGLAGVATMNIICAYPVNVDAVCNIRVEEIMHLISLSHPSIIKIELKESIGSCEDLLSCLLFCMQQGSGAEILIENEALARQIEDSFSWQFRLGGNAGIMANILAALGARPVLNSPALGPRLAGMLHAGVCVPRIAEPCQVAGELKADQVRDHAIEMEHFVFQFKKGDLVAGGQNRITAPNDNRFIATYDTVNTRLITRRHFDNYCLENIREIDGALLSGFHLAPLKEYKDIFSQKIAQIKSWKDKNPQIFIHAEMGSFQSIEIMQSLLLLLPKIPVDSLGLNEDELAASEGLAPGSSPVHWQETMQVAQRLRKSLGIFRVSVHTRDYILSVMLQGKITAKEELFALQSGAKAAAALAATGLVTGEPPEEINPVGLEANEEFCRNGATASGRGAFLHFGEEIISLMPSLLAKRPKITVGLGDTATATIFFQELLAIRESRV